VKKAKILGDENSREGYWSLEVGIEKGIIPKA
jgi:hypothetical protein